MECFFWRQTTGLEMIDNLLPECKCIDMSNTKDSLLLAQYIRISALCHVGDGLSTD